MTGRDALMALGYLAPFIGLACGPWLWNAWGRAIERKVARMTGGKP